MLYRFRLHRNDLTTEATENAEGDKRNEYRTMLSEVILVTRRLKPLLHEQSPSRGGLKSNDIQKAINLFFPSPI